MGLLDPPGFRRNRHGQIWLHLGDADRVLLGDLLTQLAELLDEPEPGGPEDPLVDAGRDRPECRAPRGSGPGAPVPRRLRGPPGRRRVPAVHPAGPAHREAGPHRRPPGPAWSAPRRRGCRSRRALAWLGALNDLRLTLGTRLEVREDSHDDLLQLASDDPRRSLYLVYDWLTYHQEKLVQALQKGIRR